MIVLLKEPSWAVILVTSGALTAVSWMVKFTDFCPTGTTTVAGTVAPAELLVILTVIGDVAVFVKVTTPVIGVEPAIP